MNRFVYSGKFLNIPKIQAALANKDVTPEEALEILRVLLDDVNGAYKVIERPRTKVLTDADDDDEDEDA